MAEAPARVPRARVAEALPLVLAKLRDGATLRDACSVAGVSTTTVHDYARANPEFDRRLTEAWPQRGRPGKHLETSWHPVVLTALASGASRRKAAAEAGIWASLLRRHQQDIPEFAAELDMALWMGEVLQDGEALIASLRKALIPKPERQLAPCGTPAAYDRHISHKETPCSPCRAANAARARTDPRMQLNQKAARHARRMLAAKLEYHAEIEKLREQERARTDVSPKSVNVRVPIALARAHPEEYRALLEQAREQLRAEAGQPAI